jgi:hypothetical protein
MICTGIKFDEIKKQVMQKLMERMEGLCKAYRHTEFLTHKSYLLMEDVIHVAANEELVDL